MQTRFFPISIWCLKAIIMPYSSHGQETVDTRAIRALFDADQEAWASGDGRAVLLPTGTSIILPLACRETTVRLIFGALRWAIGARKEKNAFQKFFENLVYFWFLFKITLDKCR